MWWNHVCIKISCMSLTHTGCYVIGQNGYHDITFTLQRALWSHVCLLIGIMTSNLPEREYYISFSSLRMFAQILSTQLSDMYIMQYCIYDTMVTSWSVFDVIFASLRLFWWQGDLTMGIRMSCFHLNGY